MGTPASRANSRTYLREIVQLASRHQLSGLWLDGWCFHLGAGEHYEHGEFCAIRASVGRRMHVVIWLPRARPSGRRQQLRFDSLRPREVVHVLLDQASGSRRGHCELLGEQVGDRLEAEPRAAALRDGPVLGEPAAAAGFFRLRASTRSAQKKWK